jgi:hypothetical protein
MDKREAYLMKFPRGLRKRLKAEATATQRNLRGYLQYLIETHPDRKHKAE